MNVYPIVIFLILAMSIAIFLVLQYSRRRQSEYIKEKLKTECILKHYDALAAITDPAGTIESTSGLFEKSFKSNSSKRPITSFENAIAEQCRYDYKSILKYVIREKKPVLDFETKVVAGEDCREMALTVIPIIANRNEVIGLINIFRQTREQSHLRADPGRIERLTNIGQIAAGIAHELNTPLGSIILSADILKDTDIPQSMTGEVDRIKRQAEHCSNVVKQLLAYVKKEEPVRKKQNIESIINKVKSLVETELKKYNVALNIDIKTKDTEIFCNENQIEQLFFNLFSNSIHVIGKNGKIDIQIGKDLLLNQVAVTFTDNGPGIPADHIDKVFDPFFTTKAGPEGTGLGLALCKKIILEHDGRIEVESNMGKGASFKLYFPVA